MGFLPSLPYYQALALQNLGQAAEANQKLQNLLASARGTQNRPDCPAQPNSQPLKQDDRKIKRIQGAYIIGLAHLGLGQNEEARRAFQEIIALDPYYQLSQLELQFLV